jgi:hypothetical protein
MYVATMFQVIPHIQHMMNLLLEPMHLVAPIPRNPSTTNSVSSLRVDICSESGALYATIRTLPHKCMKIEEDL